MEIIGMTESDKAACLVCGSPKSRQFCRKDGMAYCCCDSCQHVYLENPPNEEELIDLYKSSDSHATSEIKTMWDYSDSKRLLVYRPLLDRIKALTPMGNLLDIGCSNGSFVSAACRAGWDGYGVELAKKSSELARDRGVNVYTSELSELEFPSDCFSVITMWQVIEHLHSPKSLIAEIARILKPGGILALSTPNVKSIGCRLLRSEWVAVEPKVHMHLFNPSGLARLVNDCGLETRDLRTLDIQPATVRQLIRKVKRDRTTPSKNYVATMVDSLSESRIKSIFRIRRWVNVPLDALGLGEDIYGYFTKPNR